METDKRTTKSKPYMRHLLKIATLGLCVLSGSARAADESPAKQFLRYVYGADVGDILAICLPSDDLWMLHGAKNTNALAAVEALSIDARKRSGVYTGVIQTDVYFIELKDGKVDP